MSIFWEKDQHSGRRCIVVSQYWPDGGPRFRRRVANKDIAKKLDLKIRAAVANGTWVELRRQLKDPPPEPLTIAEFADVYMEDYCRKNNDAPQFKKYNLEPIKRILGHVPLKDLTSAHGQ